MSVVDWVERAIGRPLNPDQARCVQVLCSFSQPYNLQLIGDGWHSALTDEPWAEHGGDDEAAPLVQPVVLREKYIVVNLLGSLATYDLSELTRLVLAGHEHAVRVEITPKLYLWVQDDDIHEGEEPRTGPGACLQISLHARNRERGDDGHNWEWHPTIEQVLARG